MVGRPTIFSEEVVARICREVADGRSLRQICEADDMPTRETVRVWLRDDTTFSAQYARAREEQADHFADEMIEIADTTDDPQRAKLQIDARKWKASRMAPKKYGDRVALEHGGSINLTHEQWLASLDSPGDPPSSS